MPDQIHILLVEDNPADVDLTRESLLSCKVIHTMAVAIDGEDAMAYLRRQGTHYDALRPDLVFLDLNLPRKDGREVLAEMKNDKDLCSIPVVILTSSKSEEDVAKSYQLQASAYIVKPVDLEGLGKVVKGIEEFWFSVVRFPSRS